MARILSPTQPTKVRIAPTRGRYSNRTSAYAAVDPRIKANKALVGATMAVFRNVRNVSLLRSPTSIYFQASRVGSKSTNGIKKGPSATWLGILREVTINQ